jgi:hypothetical protein
MISESGREAHSLNKGGNEGVLVTRLEGRFINAFGDFSYRRRCIRPCSD